MLRTALLISCLIFPVYANSSDNLRLTLIVEDDISRNLVRRIKKEIKTHFNVKFNIIWRKDIGNDEELIPNILNSSILIKSKVDKRNNTFYLFLTNKKLLFHPNYSSELRGFAKRKDSTAIASLSRVKKESDSLGLSVQFQFIKLIKHEILHLIALDHCETSNRCMMVSSFPPENFYNSFNKICLECYNKVDTLLVNKSISEHLGAKNSEY